MDSAAVTGLSGRTTPPIKFEFSIQRTEELGSLFLLLPDADTTAIVELMQKDNEPLRREQIREGRVDFFFLKPGKYYIRLFHDRNGNGQWDTGDYAQRLQPEEVFYFPSAIDVRANWDIEQTWRIHELPLTKQKPAEITKQKDNKKKTPQNRNLERLKKLGRAQ